MNDMKATAKKFLDNSNEQTMRDFVTSVTTWSHELPAELDDRTYDATMMSLSTRKGKAEWVTIAQAVTAL